MSEAACLVLAILRYAQRKNINLNKSISALCFELGITEIEKRQLRQIIKDDIRAMNTEYPAYEQVNKILEQMERKSDQ
jgi:hypothetical protein